VLISLVICLSFMPTNLTQSKLENNISKITG
jgi:hypothetical protein